MVPPLEIFMARTLSAVLRLTSACLFAALAVRAQPQSAPQPKFQVEIQSTGEKGPTYTITNLTGKTVTALVTEISSSTNSQGKAWDSWDALVQGQPPIKPGASLTSYLGHLVGAPLPDKVELVAGIWEDGETFGKPVWVKAVLANRETLVSAYEQSITLLQQGLDQNWTGDQYLTALQSKANSTPVNSIRSTLQANAKPGHDPQAVPIAMRDLLAYFKRNLEVIRQAKRPPGTPNNR
jgi:hypothetical protein